MGFFNESMPLTTLRPTVLAPNIIALPKYRVANTDTSYKKSSCNIGSRDGGCLIFGGSGYGGNWLYWRDRRGPMVVAAALG